MGQFGTDHDARDVSNTGEPFFWRVSAGVHYTEVAYSAAIRPPLLSEWEMRRAQEFKSTAQRNRWLAARTVAKALVREQLQMHGIVELRDRGDRTIVYRSGLPVADAWLSIEHRAGKITAILADRPIALDVQRIDHSAGEVLRKVVSRHDTRMMQRLIKDSATAQAVAWAAKAAALKALSISDPTVPLSAVQLDRSMGLSYGERKLQLMGVRVMEHVVVAIVGRPLLHEQPETKVVVDHEPVETPQSSLVSAFERSMARAKRISEGRARWQRLRWQT